MNDAVGLLYYETRRGCYWVMCTRCGKRESEFMTNNRLLNKFWCIYPDQISPFEQHCYSCYAKIGSGIPDLFGSGVFKAVSPNYIISDNTVTLDIQ